MCSGGRLHAAARRSRVPAGEAVGAAIESRESRATVAPCRAGVKSEARLTPSDSAPTLCRMPRALDPPVSKTIPLASPESALAALASLPHPFLLHSALEGEGARWSFFGADPFAVYSGERYE